MNATLPIVEEFKALKSDVERAAWLMQLSDSTVCAFIAGINAALDRAGFVPGRVYIAARFAAHLAVRSIHGELPQAVAMALNLAHGDLVAIVKKGAGE